MRPDHPTDPSKILFLDIETVPAVYHFGELDEHAAKLFSDKTRYEQERNGRSAEEIYAERGGILAEFGGAEGLRDALSTIKANTQQQKAGAIARIIANRNNAFSKADLDAMPLEQVLKLDRTLSPADYSGAGGYATNAGDDEWKAYEAPKAG